jgi:hypothetical protein
LSDLGVAVIDNKFDHTTKSNSQGIQFEIRLL